MLPSFGMGHADQLSLDQTEYESLVVTHGRGSWGGATGHISSLGRSLCGVEKSRPHLNIEVGIAHCALGETFTAWLESNREFPSMCRRCVAIYDARKRRSKSKGHL